MRLIDADAFIECLGLDAENAREDNLGEIVTLEDFDRQPTAYDAEKVVEQLETMKNDRDCKVYCYSFSHGKCENYDKAIEIVKSGGID